MGYGSRERASETERGKATMRKCVQVGITTDGKDRSLNPLKLLRKSVNCILGVMLFCSLPSTLVRGLPTRTKPYSSEWT